MHFNKWYLIRRNPRGCTAQVHNFSTLYPDLLRRISKLSLEYFCLLLRLYHAGDNQNEDMWGAVAQWVDSRTLKQSTGVRFLFHCFKYCAHSPTLLQVIQLYE